MSQATKTGHASRRRVLGEATPAVRLAEPRPGRSWHWFVWPALLVAGYLLFAHGCHGDEDTELLLRMLFQ